MCVRKGEWGGGGGYFKCTYKCLTAECLIYIHNLFHIHTKRNCHFLANLQKDKALKFEKKGNLVPILKPLSNDFQFTGLAQ